MTEDPTAADAIQLREYLDAATTARGKISWDGDYPEYPREISDLMHYITNSTWCNHQYDPTEAKNILERLGSADFNEIRSILTAVSRSERFCTGAWKSTLEGGTLDDIVSRAEQITKA